MHPELVEQIDQRDDAKDHRRYAQHRQRQVKHPAQQTAGGGLAQRGRQVVGLALVVHHVRCPQKRHLVAGAVQPVVAQVVDQQGQQPPVPVFPEFGIGEKRQVLKRQRVGGQPDEFEQHAGDLAQQAQAQAVNGVAQGIAAVRHLAQAQLSPVPPPFQGHGGQKHREGKDDDFGHGRAVR